MDVDDATGIVGVALGAAVGLAAVKMTTDMVSDLAGPQRKNVGNVVKLNQDVNVKQRWIMEEICLKWKVGGICKWS